MELANFPQVPILNSSPYSAKWITYGLWHTYCASFYYDMKIFSLHSDWDCSPEDVLKITYISVMLKKRPLREVLYSIQKATFHSLNLVWCGAETWKCLLHERGRSKSTENLSVTLCKIYIPINWQPPLAKSVPLNSPFKSELQSRNYLFRLQLRLRLQLGRHQFAHFFY